MKRVTNTEINDWANMYTDKKLGIQQIADSVSFSYSIVRKRLKQKGVKIRSVSEINKLRHKRGGYEHLKKHIDRKLLAKLYLQEKKSLAEIQDFFGLSYFIIHRCMQESGVPIRTTGETKKYKAFRQKEELDLKYDFSLGFVLGTVMGDGCVCKTVNYAYDIWLKVTNKKFAEEFHSNLKQLTGKTAGFFEVDQKSEIRGKKYTTHFYCVKLGSKLWYLILSELQETILAYDGNNIPFMKGFIKGFYESDGYCHITETRRQISLSNTSEPLLKLIKSMLEKLGIKGVNVYQKHQRKQTFQHHKTAYWLYIGRRKEVDKFIEIFGIKPKGGNN